MRIKEINMAREKIKAKPYLGTDELIKEAVHNGLCEELVKGDETYETAQEERLLRDEPIARAILEYEANAALKIERRRALTTLQSLLEVQSELESYEETPEMLSLFALVTSIGEQGDSFYRQTDFKRAEARYREALDLLTQRKDSIAVPKAKDQTGINCPIPSKLFDAIDNALAVGDSELVKRLQNCPEA